MNQIDTFAIKHYGWTADEFGDARGFLDDMRDMLVREIRSIQDGSATAETYGFKDNESFLKDNRRQIAQIDDILGYNDNDEQRHGDV